MSETSEPIRTLIVDDESLVRELVRSLLKHDPAVQVVGECGQLSINRVRTGTFHKQYLTTHRLVF